MPQLRRRPGSPRGASELLDMFFLDMRAALLETAAALDRIERAPGGSAVRDDARLLKIRRACDIINGSEGGRAERFLMLFSDPVDSGSAGGNP